MTAARRFKAAIDGGSRGNPGPAAWGVAVLDGDTAVEGHAASIGRATNNVAEYHALLEALRLARRRDAQQVEILADSELIVRQIEGRYRVRHPDLIPLHDEARSLIRGFREFRIRHIRRKDNREADRLVNAALDRAAAGEKSRIRETQRPAAADD